MKDMTSSSDPVDLPLKKKKKKTWREKKKMLVASIFSFSFTKSLWLFL